MSAFEATRAGGGLRLLSSAGGNDAVHIRGRSVGNTVGSSREREEQMRRSLVAAAVAGVVALAGAVLIQGTAHAGATPCQGGFHQPGGTYGNVVVPSSANGSNFCFLNGATVQGQVKVQAGGAVLIANTTIASNLSSASAGTATGGSGLTFSVVLCGTTVGGQVSITSSQSLVEIGTDDFATCVTTAHPIQNTLNGVSNDISNNRGGVEVESNQVNGNLSVNKNHGFIPGVRDPDAASNETTSVNNNSGSTHRLTCMENAPVVNSSGNTFQSIVGQCGP
jgi:hypothetical protein